jgi:hypothetical protein
LPTVGSTVWLDGALLLTTTQNWHGIVNSKTGSRPRYAKHKMAGEKLATPQPKPLSHTLWSGVAAIQTESDLNVVNDLDDDDLSDSDVVEKLAEQERAAFIEKLADEERKAFLKSLTRAGGDDSGSTANGGPRVRSTMLVPIAGRVKMIDISFDDDQQLVVKINRKSPAQCETFQ